MVPGGQPLIYLCGHSLGLAPRAALDYVSEELADWAALGVGGHHTATRPWIDYAQNFTKGLQHLTGALANEVVAMNSLTVNLHLMMTSFYRPVGMRDKILIEAGAFSSDRARHPRAALLAQARRRGHAWWSSSRAPARRLLRIEDIEARSRSLGSDLALVLWPGVQYRTGQAFDLRAHCARRAQAPARIGGLRPGACHRQPALAVARLGRRLRRVVFVQVPECGSGRDWRLLSCTSAISRTHRRGFPAGGDMNPGRASRCCRSSGPRPAPPAGR